MTLCCLVGATGLIKGVRTSHSLHVLVSIDPYKLLRRLKIIFSYPVAPRALRGSLIAHVQISFSTPFKNLIIYSHLAYMFKAFILP